MSPSAGSKEERPLEECRRELLIQTLDTAGKASDTGPRGATSVACGSLAAYERPSPDGD